MTTGKLDERNLRQAIDLAAKEYVTTAGLQAAKVGAKILENVYRDVLLKVTKKPGGPNFIRAWEAIKSKTGVFESGDGVYLVVGSEVAGGQRLAPQVLWGERGTDERHTKAGSYRGRMLPQGWLQKAIVAGMEDAKEAMRRKLASLSSK